jgi:hypothetical protein
VRTRGLRRIALLRDVVELRVHGRE